MAQYRTYEWIVEETEPDGDAREIVSVHAFAN